jgi:hypothetical protein
MLGKFLDSKANPPNIMRPLPTKIINKKACPEQSEGYFFIAAVQNFNQGPSALQASASPFMHLFSSKRNELD